MKHSMSNRMKGGMGILLPIGLLLFVAGCGPSQQEMMAKDQLERAKKAYADAKADPHVQEYAPLQLQDAGNALQAAQQAKEPGDTIQLGYIAERKAGIAATVAAGKVAERDMAGYNVEKAELTAQKRTLEADRARRDAEKARSAAAADAERAAAAEREAQQARLAAQAEAEKAARAKAEADQLVKELSNLKAQQTERGIVLTIGDVLFPTGKAELSAEAKKGVDKLAAFLKKYPNRNVLIEGHTDSVGGDEYNVGLSNRRAESVKKKLVDDGIEGARVTTVGYGKKYPVADNDTKGGRAQNRRVEVIVLNEGVKAETQMRQ